MREERGQIAGDLKVAEPYELWGKILGNVTVARGGKLYVRGSIYGNLRVEPGGRVHIFGNVQGNVTVSAKAKLIHSGVVGGDVVNRGGRVYIELTSKIFGKVKTRSGETLIEPKPAAYTRME